MKERQVENLKTDVYSFGDLVLGDTSESRGGPGTNVADLVRRCRMLKGLEKTHRSLQTRTFRQSTL